MLTLPIALSPAARSRMADVDPRALAIERLARVDAPRAFRLAVDLLRDRAEAEDVVQEALARAFSAYRDLQDPAALGAWFLRVTTNLCLRLLRRRHLRRRALAWLGLGPEPSARAETPDPAPPADARIASAADTARLAAALDRLPPMQRAALILRYGQSLSVPEVASALGVGPGTAKTHLHRGLSRLRGELGGAP
jgi:RNA polymerase sigma-70 factor (ECF subfamily)